MKRLFIIGICLCLSGMVSAQWHVGCEVGANWSTVKFPSYEMGGKRMTGFNIVFALKFRITCMFLVPMPQVYNNFPLLATLTHRLKPVELR